MLIAITLSIINIIINNIINVNCDIFPTDINDLKCVSLKDLTVAIIRRFIFYDIGFSVIMILSFFENFKFKGKKKL